MSAAVGIVAGSKRKVETQARIASSTTLLSTPDHTDFTFTAFDLSWFGSMDNPTITDQHLMSHWLTTGGNREWSLRTAVVTAQLQLRIFLSTDGAGNVSTPNGVGNITLAANQYFGARVTWRMSDGAVKHYFSLTDPPSWTLVGSTTLLAGGPIKNSTGVINTGGSTTANQLYGYFRRAELRNGFDGAGSLVATPDVRNLALTDTGFTDSVGKVWTLAGITLSTRPVP